MCIPLQGGSNRNISVREIDNGFEVSVSEEIKKLAKDGNNFLFDHESSTYAFDTAEEAADMVLELLEEEDEPEDDED